MVASLLAACGAAGGLLLCAAPTAGAQTSTPTATWTQVGDAGDPGCTYSCTSSPASRYGTTMAYDENTGDVVLFGGFTGSDDQSNDTWTWNGTTWSQVDDSGDPGCVIDCTSSPAARYGATMAYDLATGDVVLFGGADINGDVQNDTWTWNGTTWSQVDDSGDAGCTVSCTSSPPARYFASMAYDSATGNMLLFGGASSSASLDDTWTWNGTAWSELSPSDSPSARDGASMAYDPTAGDVVLFGGDTTGTSLNDTWTWNGTTWNQVDDSYDPGCSTTCVLSPSNRFGASIAYDSAVGDLALFGGRGSSEPENDDDTWTWDGSTWSELSPSVSPPARQYASMADDPASDEVVLFGGDGPSTTLNDTWTVTLEAPTPTPGTVPSASQPAFAAESSGLSVMLQQNGEPSLFFEGSGGSLWNYWYVPNGSSSYWGGTEIASSDIASAPVVTPQSNGAPSVFVEGTGGSLWNYWYVPNGSSSYWGSAEIAASGIEGKPNVQLQPDGSSPTVFVEGANGSLLNYWYVPNGSSSYWGSAEIVPGGGSSNIASTLQPDLSPSIFVTGANGSLLNYWYVPNGSSSYWGSAMVAVGGATGTAGVTLQPDGSPSLFVQTTGGSLLNYWYVANSSSAYWGSATVASGGVTSASSVLLQGNGEPTVFAGGAGGSVVNYWYIPSGSSSYWGTATVASSGASGEPRTTVQVANGEPTIFVPEAGGALYNYWYVPDGSSSYWGEGVVTDSGVVAF